MKFYFIAINYNGSNFTRQFIESVNLLNKNQTDNVEIIIVDNNSESDDKHKLVELKKNNSHVRILFLEENVGYFGGINKGIKCVENDKTSIFIVGNNDLTFDKDFLTNFKLIDYPKDCLVIAPNIITREGRQQNPHVVKNVSNFERIRAAVYYSNYYVGQAFALIYRTVVKKLFIKESSLTNNYGQMKIKRGIGACYILTPNFFEKYDLLDDRVFMWGEEALLSNQVESIGGFTLYDPTLKIKHYESASVSQIQSKKKYQMVKKSYKIYKKYL